MPVAPDFANLWYEAEKAVCRTYRYATVCMDRKLPCITFATKNGRLDRTVLYKRYPEYIEVVNVMEAASEKDPDRLEGIGVIRWYGKDAAMAVGFEEACAVIVCMPAVSILSAGSMLCSVNGEDIKQSENTFTHTGYAPDCRRYIRGHSTASKTGTGHKNHNCP